jgi:hypothetical protein
MGKAAFFLIVSWLSLGLAAIGWLLHS